MPKLIAGTYPAYVDSYVKLVDADTVQECVDKYSNSIAQFFKSIPESKVDYRYAEGKWSIKQMLQHIIDAERVFSYRAMSIARREAIPLPGFDENTYAEYSNADAREWKDLVEEFEAVRKSTNLLLSSFTKEQLTQRGTTNNQPNTVEAIAYTIFGHILHHMNVLRERYLQ